MARSKQKMSERLKSFKFVIIGSEKVGKSALRFQFLEKRFEQRYIPTIGVDCGMTQRHPFGFPVKLQVWDLAEATRYHGFRQMYYRGTHGALLMYDVSERSSFEQCNQYYEECIENTSQYLCIVLLGNKSDLERKVSTEEGLELAQRLEVGFMEISAKNREQVDRAFKCLLVMVWEKVKSGALSFQDLSEYYPL